MDSFELNKMAGALLATVFVLMSVRLASDAIFHTEVPEKPGFVIEAAEATAGDAGGDAPAVVEPITPLLASADAAAGEAVFKKCASCHTIDSGGANKVGPNLYGLVGRGIGTHEGFNYSAGMKEFAAGKTWDFEISLSQFITKPKAYIKGTSMGFAGVAKPDERANLIAYLRNQAATPVPLP